MLLTRVERLVLANQFAIRAILEPDSADHYEMAREVFEAGYEGAYHLYNHVGADVVTSEECAEVVAILQMYRVLNDAYAGLADKDGIDPASIKFLGFDATNEKQYAFARFLAREGKYSESLGERDIDSHCGTLLGYQMRLSVWEQCESPYKLTQEDIVRIARAA